MGASHGEGASGEPAEKRDFTLLRAYVPTPLAKMVKRLAHLNAADEVEPDNISGIVTAALQLYIEQPNIKARLQGDGEKKGA
jgi:hypothetical protein